jgi:hypothetical protein
MVTLPVVQGFFDTRADFLVNYAPFHFQADMRITVGVRWTTDEAVTSSDTLADISAELHLYGPPIGGRAQVDFLFWHIPFDFGPGKQDPGPVSLTEFYNLVLQLKGSEVVAQGSTTTPDNQAHRFTCQEGLITKDKKDAADNADTKADNAVWTVRASPFSFLISSSVVAQSITAGKTVTQWDIPVYAKPLRLSGTSKLGSDVTVSLTVVGDKNNVDLMDNMRVARYTGMVPRALWGECETPSHFLLSPFLSTSPLSHQ